MMAPYQSNRRGSLVVDLVIHGIPIRRATGQPDTRKGRSTVAAIVALLRSFGEPATERLDLLRDLAEGRRTIPALWRAHRRGELTDLPAGALLTGDLEATWARWVTRSAGQNQQNRRGALRALIRGGPAVLGDLPARLRAVREHYAQANQPRTANQHRAITLAFARDLLGKRSAIYAALADIPPLPYVAAKGHPQTVAEARAIQAALPGPHGRHWWELCLTGMRQKEYFSRQWEELDDRIEIRGTKRRASQRMIPKVESITGPATQYRAFQKALQQLGREVTPKDARASFSNWIYRAGLPLVRRDIYRGHSAKDMAALYEWSDVRRVLVDDAEAIRRYLAPEKRPGGRLKRVG